MKKEIKRVNVRTGIVASNDGTVAVITVSPRETLRIIRFGSIQTEAYFTAQWAVGKEVTVEGK